VLGRDRPAGGDNWAHGVIRDIAYMGDMSVFMVRLDAGREVRVTQANRTRKPRNSSAGMSRST